MLLGYLTELQEAVQRVMMGTSSSYAGWYELLPAQLGDAFKYVKPLPGKSSLEHPDPNPALYLHGLWCLAHKI